MEKSPTDYSSDAVARINDAMKCLDNAIRAAHQQPSDATGWPKSKMIGALVRARKSLVEATQELP
jgi:hypothetical protein